MQRRDLLKFAGAGAAIGVATYALPKTRNGPAIFVPCFDVYPTTVTVAGPMLERHGIVSSFFVYFDKLDVNSGQPTTDQLIEFQSKGHEIAAYSGGYDDGSPAGLNFLQLSQKPNGLKLARDRLLAIKAKAQAKGFDPISLTPYQREWSKPLRDITEGISKNVRAVNIRAPGDPALYPQPVPVPDPLYVRKGGLPSLGYLDTAETICAPIENVCVSGGIYFMVIHQVGVDTNNSVRAPDFDAGLAFARKQINAGRLLNMTFADACRAP